MNPEEQVMLKKWRLLLGADDSDGSCEYNSAEKGIDQTLTSLYDPSQGLSAGLGSSSPSITKWLKNIRDYFPKNVVHLLQKDAIDKLGLNQLLLEPEVLNELTPDINLLGQIMELSEGMNQEAKNSARQIVKEIVDEILQKFRNPLISAVNGALRRSIRTQRPKMADINWHRTILENLKNYQPDYKTVIPERRIGFGRRQTGIKDIVVCVDQSGSMAQSVVYASLFAAVMASMPALNIKLVLFDTKLVDLSDQLHDPVEVLFGSQLGGGTDIGMALQYCNGLITKPNETYFIMISDLCDGGDARKFKRVNQEIVHSGVKMAVLYALSDEGTPIYDAENAKFYSSLNVPCFSCSPDQFPDLMNEFLSTGQVSHFLSQQVEN